MSNVSPITTHSADAKKRLLYQYHGADNLKNLMDALFLEEVQAAENVLTALKNRLNIDESSGIQLDRIGEIVGQPRFYSTMPDAAYRMFLKARIGKNVSEGDIERIISVWKLMSNASLVHLVEAFPCEIDLYYNNPVDDTLAGYAFDLIQEVAGSGIRVQYIAVFDADNAFSFSSVNSEIAAKPNTGGFRSVKNNDIGGKLSYMQNKAEYGVLYETPVFSFYPSDPDIDTAGFGTVADLSEGGKFAYLNK